MLLSQLIDQFSNVKQQQPTNPNELLDFLQKQYVSGEYCLKQYYFLFNELHKQGAEKPESYYVKFCSTVV
ncbi:YppF family protein [Bacillus taeanensis]|uniref:Uncharacterized protein n=1 Tax=Bacillus taeanensis TaxID=273032 RepID=A0A366XMX6_9BACI|nr:YppF family protein [Bacillus taeanensis]RBW67700.1 hypothetical protein DS031_20725 [Bacillus taeanensis]